MKPLPCLPALTQRHAGPRVHLALLSQPKHMFAQSPSPEHRQRSMASKIAANQSGGVIRQCSLAGQNTFVWWWLFTRPRRSPGVGGAVCPVGRRCPPLGACAGTGGGVGGGCCFRRRAAATHPLRHLLCLPQLLLARARLQPTRLVQEPNLRTALRRVNCTPGKHGAHTSSF